MSINRCRNLTIFEGPDGSGKSTLAKDFARETGALYVHHGPMLQMGWQLPRLYVEAMLPALLGLTDVVFDRSWLSEMPYGKVFRGFDRIGPIKKRMLERLAFRCATIVVRCCPPWEVVKANFILRRGQEYLQDTKQLKRVYQLYEKQTTALPTLTYDYTTQDPPFKRDIVNIRSQAHQLDIRSAGNWNAPCVIVGETFDGQTDWDTYYQWPFGSFADTSTDYWFTEMLEQHRIPESSLLWVNIDQPNFESIIEVVNEHNIFACGVIAAAALNERNVGHTPINHPLSLRKNQTHVLPPLLKKALKGLL